MTMQVRDTFRYKRKTYEIESWSAANPVPIESLGEKPVMAGTFCWRGYVALYALKRSRLVLDTLFVHLIDPSPSTGQWLDKKGPVFMGVSPTYPTDKMRSWNNHYQGLNMAIEYTGSVLLIDEFLQKDYGNRELATYWQYKSVVELVFEHGVLKSQNNVSAHMAEIRKADRIYRQTVERLIDRAFTHPYTPSTRRIADLLQWRRT
ncbi:MAG: hypothetical protein R2834_02560 [Rhodothermales bacterium]